MCTTKKCVIAFLFLILSFAITSCGTGDQTATNEDQMATTTTTSPIAAIEQTPQATITLGDMEAEIRQIAVETVFQKNCGGTETLENTTEKRETITHIIEVGAGYEVNANGEVGLPGGIASVGLGAAVTGRFGYTYGFSEEIARTITVRASPGTNMQHQISLQEVWQIGEALVIVNGQEYKIPFSYRSDFSLELIESVDLGDCPVQSPDSQTPENTATPDDSPTPIQTHEPPTPTPEPIIPTATPAPVEEVLQNEIVILSENADNIFNWERSAPNLTTQVVYEGEVAFIPTGNNSFQKELATIGYEDDEVRFVSMQLYLLRKDAGFLLQVKIDRSWEHRWGFDGRSIYQGYYTWSRRGQTLNLPVGEWIEVKLDLINDLGARPGQTITGLGFAAQDGNMIYDNVRFSSSPPLTSCLPPTSQTGEGENTFPEIVVLSNKLDNTYTWEDGSPYITTQAVYEGDAAFIPTANNTFYQDLATIGYEANEVRFISMKLCLLKPEAGLLLQVNIDRSWEHRWGFDGRSTYKGAYTWARRGQTPNIPVGEWVDVKLDLIDDLGARPGQLIKGLAFAAADGNMIYDLVGFSSSE